MAEVLHMPVCRAADGRWLYAPLGALRAVDAGRLVVCHLCGQLLTHISRAHLQRRHQMDLPQYRQLAGLNRKQSLTAPALAARRRREGHRRFTDNEQVRAGLALGQQMARSGDLKALADECRPQASAQSRQSTAHSLAAARARARKEADARHQVRAVELGFDSVESLLRARYVVERRTVASIATELMLSETQVGRLLSRCEIPRRTGRARAGDQMRATE